jgi:hypothetical protein
VAWPRTRRRDRPRSRYPVPDSSSRSLASRTRVQETALVEAELDKEALKELPGPKMIGADAKRQAVDVLKEEHDLGITMESLARPISGADLAALLGHFLIGTQCFSQGVRIEDPHALSPEFRELVVKAQSDRQAWCAWSTERGTMFAAGQVDVVASRQNHFVIFIEWYLKDLERHAAWWRCYPKRPRDWIVGRGIG